ncbi:MAG: DNA polymerase III subunit gamma and tau [Actinobacteria bacterium]|nr:DNA polymerase III subunit gamma and tau [Actinomycetota bacterium]
MTLALYRTYRPGRFADVIGQEHVTGPLSRALDSDRVHHAYLFSGPRGCGKTSSARILARSLNCSEGPTSEPCAVCDSCVALAPNGPGSLDVIELDAASNRGIDQARDLRERAAYAPASSRYKVYIIDEAHQLTPEAANALLKLVEEPPAHLRFIFATTEPDKLIGTIRSRTHQYAFRLVPDRTLQDHLASVCDSEGIAYEPAALALVARAGQGSVRDALSVLGQLIGGSGAAGLTYDDAVAQLGFTADSLLDEVTEALATSDGPALFSVIDRVVTGGHDPRRFATDLLERLRDLIVLAAAPDAASHGLVDASPDRLEVLAGQAERLGLAALSRAADLTNEGLSELKGATAPRLQLELLAARLLLPGADDDVRGTLVRLDRVEARLAQGPADVSAAAATHPVAAPSAPPPRLSQVAPSTATSPASVLAVPVVSAPAVPPASVVAEAPPASPPSSNDSPRVDLAAVRTMWPAVLEKLKLDSRVAWTAFERSAPIGVSGDTVTVAVPESGTLAFARKSGHDTRLREAILAVMHVDLTPDLTLDPGAVAPSGVASDPADQSAPAKKARAAAKAAEEPTVADSDADDDQISGVALAARELGAKVVAEYDES